MTQDFHYIQREDRPDGLCVLTFNRPGSSANVLNQAVLAELAAHLEAIAPDTRVRGVIVRSAKPAIFVAGADLSMFEADLSDEEIAHIVDAGQQTFARLAALRVPTVAAIRGACVGGGFELALACDWRVAANEKATKIGLPEVSLGLIPAWGGCTRLPRLVGLVRALPSILAGTTHSARRARELGFIDDVVPAEYLIDGAVNTLVRGKRAAGRRRWTDFAPVRAIVVRRAHRSVLARTRGEYPAPLSALAVTAAAGNGTIDESLAREKSAVVALARGPVAQNLIHLFHLRERARHLAVPPEILARNGGSAAAPTPVRRVAVIGAGLMGAGIAQWLASRGVSVLLRDVAAEPLARGMSRIADLFREAVGHRVLTEIEARRALDRITPVSSDVPLHAQDLVIEAAPETLALKQSLLRDLELRIGVHTILATNTSALSIADLSSVLAQPERLVGIHFFNPVHRMQLVEIVHGPHTGAAAVETALHFVDAIGKLPVLVRDRPGFLVNRILMPYLVEAVRLFDEGHSPHAIDAAMLAFGMPMGPLRLCDEVGLDTAQHVARDLESRLATVAKLPLSLDEMLARGWTGRKGGCGFYVHDDARASGHRRLRENPRLNQIARQHTHAPRVAPALLRDRVVLVMINEGARCLEEEVVATADDVDFALVMGTGWAPFRGGPLRYADAVGIPAVVERLTELAHASGPNFEPGARLRAMAASGARFFGEPRVAVNTSRTKAGGQHATAE